MEVLRTYLPLEASPTAVTNSADTKALPLPKRDVTTNRILVCDRDDEACGVINACVPRDQYDVVYCREFADVSEILREGRQCARPFDILLCGLTPPFDREVSVLSVLKELQELRESHPQLKVVLIAPQEVLAFASEIKLACVEAFVLKPLHSQEVRGGIERALKRAGSQLRAHGIPSASALASLASRVPAISNTEDPSASEDGRDLGLIGTSVEMKKVVALIRKVGRSNVNVLLTGESGSGKEMVASAIHKVSDRSKKPFIAINCAAIPRELLESELFGHAKGAFTGATAARRGLFEEAHEGTILLDEIGDLPLPLQAKILRLLQTRQVKALGQNAVKEVDVRIISATHKNLKSLIQKGEFREDLYYRLNVMPIHLPALRERQEDIVVLAEHFLKRYSQRSRGPAPVLTRRAAAKLMNLPWKGNVRELENVIERAIVLSDGQSITENEILSEEMQPSRVTTEDLFNSGLTLRDIEREYIKYVLTRTGNRKEAATRILGIDRKTLYRKEKVYGIREPSELN